MLQEAISDHLTVVMKNIKILKNTVKLKENYVTERPNCNHDKVLYA